MPRVVCGVEVGVVSGKLYWHLPSQTLFYHFNGGRSEKEAYKAGRRYNSNPSPHPDPLTTLPNTLTSPGMRFSSSNIHN